MLVTDTDTNEVADATPVGEGLEQEQPTPETGQEEVKEGQPEIEELRKKYEELLEKSEKDISGLKSSLQKRESEITKEFRDKERKYQEQIEELRRATLSEKDRDAYEKDLSLNRLKELEEQTKAAEQEKQQLSQYYYYLDYFTNELGVSRKDLALDEGVEKLFASGMVAVSKKLKEATVAPAPAKPVSKAKTPPEVAQPGTGTVGGGMTLKELAKKKVGGDSIYDIDKLFKLIESGQLPADLLNEVLAKQK